MSETKKDQAMELFRKYKKVFALDNFDLRRAQNVEHTINTNDHRPIAMRPIRRSKPLEAIVNEEVN